MAKTIFKQEYATVTLDTVEIGCTDIDMGEEETEIEANDTKSNDIIYGDTVRDMSMTVSEDVTVDHIETKTDVAFSYKQEDSTGAYVTYTGTVKFNSWRLSDSVGDDVQLIQYSGKFTGAITRTKTAAS